MPINVKGVAKKPAASQTEQANLGGIGNTEPSENQQAQQPPQSGGTGFAPQKNASFLMTGSAQQNQVQQVKAQQDLRKKLQGSAFEFYLEVQDMADLYFLDGTLIGENTWDTPMVNVHMMHIGGDFVKFICMQNTEGDCIACKSNVEGSDARTFQLFSVINTKPYKVKGGKEKGKIIPARLQLFPATLKAREILVNKAKNRGGSLAGKLWRFSRTGDKELRTGNDIDFLSEVPMEGVIKKYPKLSTDHEGNRMNAPTAPIDYTTAYGVITNAELAALRPDIAAQAGWSGPSAGGIYGGGVPTENSLGQQDLDDEIPF